MSPDKKSKFVGRFKEIESLRGLRRKFTSSLVVIRGRRRIGKSRLAEEYAKEFSRSIVVTGIPPEPGVTATSEREEFLRQVQEQRLPLFRCDDWGNLLDDLARECQSGSILVVFDEITWMGSKDPTFLPKLKTAWDVHFKKNPNLVMILSGSNSAWIERNILNSTGFFGRVSLRILLEELNLSECNRFWEDYPGEIAPYEKFKILAVTGGVPRYLEELRPDLSAESNLHHLCFNREGLLFSEFDQIFHDLFRKRGTFYKRLVEQLVHGCLSITDLATKLKRKRGGDMTRALDDLTQSGFLARDYGWSFDTNLHSSHCRYRVCDNYLRFYLRYIYPHRKAIAAGKMPALPSAWHSILGLQFENLVISNGPALCRLLEVPIGEGAYAGPYLQTQRKRRSGCQVDYLIQTRHNCLYVCEIKFQKGLVGVEVIDEVKKKMARIQIPRGYSMRPVLIHVNGVSEWVEDAGFFSRIVDFSEFLTADC